MNINLYNLRSSLLDFFFPRFCVACEKQITEWESAICLPCFWSMPRYSSFHVEHLASKFWGKIKIYGVFAYLKFQKGNAVQQVLHAIKYKNQRDLAIWLGQCMGREIKWQVDVIVPVPLHKDKWKSRGFNQATFLALGISKILNVQIREDLLQKKRDTGSQTKSGGRLSRFFNLKEAFVGVPKDDIPKSILLVDDVLTTGATLEAASVVLYSLGVKEIYIACLAAAD
jgi:ComF family protein